MANESAVVIPFPTKPPEPTWKWLLEVEEDAQGVLEFIVKNHFEDLAGRVEAIRALKEVIALLENPPYGE
jgi:hypothetical protein